MRARYSALATLIGLAAACGGGRNATPGHGTGEPSLRSEAPRKQDAGATAPTRRDRGTPASLENIDFDTLVGGVGLPLTGMHGRFDVTGRLDPGTDFGSASGSLEVHCAECRFVPVEASGPLAGPPEFWAHLPELELGSWTMRLTILDGGVELVDPLVIEHGGLRFELRGRVVLREPLGSSRVTAEVEIVFSEGLLDGDERLRFLVATAKRTARIEPEGRALGFRILGSLAEPRLVNAGAEAGQRPQSSAAPGRSATRDSR